jgi:5-carboxymethyl-2-hydroxymuconate isomerase
MPHLIVEHSSNVAQLTDIDALVAALHGAALATGVAPLDALRTRAASRRHYAIGDRDPANAFVAVTARLGRGRTDAEKRLLLDALMAALDSHLGDAQRNVMLSVELQEIDPDLRVNKNNLRPVIAARQTNDTEHETE